MGVCVPGGDDEAELQVYAWFDANSGRKTHPVGELVPNGFGLYDMHGNVWEWCADAFAADYYAQSPTDDPSGPLTGSDRVYRGGCWYYTARYCQSWFRRRIVPTLRNYGLGFRVARSLPVGGE